MTERWAGEASQVLRALAELSPSGEQSAGGLVVPTEWFRWLSARSVQVFDNRERQRAFEASAYLSPNGPNGEVRPDVLTADIDKRFADQIASMDRLRGGGNLRVGWLWVAGRLPEVDGKRRRVFLPLVSMSVRVDREFGGRTALYPSSDHYITPLVEDVPTQRRLEQAVATGSGAFNRLSDPVIPAAMIERLASYARSVASAAGLPARVVMGADEGPEALMRRDGLVIVAGVGVYSRVEESTTSRAGSLRAWADGDLEPWTAFHAAYVDVAPPARPDDPTEQESPFLLTPTQREAVRLSAQQPITVVSGAPGTGKSHTIAAIALAAIARGEDVLVAAKADATVEALLDLFERAPGPAPVVFGSSERRDALAKRLANGVHPKDRDVVREAREAMQAAIAERDALGLAMRLQLDAEAQLAAGRDVTAVRVIAPGFFAPQVDLDALDRVRRAALVTGGGFWTRRRTGRAARDLRRAADGDPTASLDSLANALDAARAARVGAALTAAGGLDLADDWLELRRRDDAAHERTARWLADEVRSEARLGRAALGAIAAVATALRSGRAARRAQLLRIDDDRLTQALPLWLGTLADLDDLLPATAGLFDLVVIDEASSVDQPLAAPALLRGKRAVIVGDPHQLRHVSFLADEQQQAVLARHHLDAVPSIAAKLDVRRNSAFDLAAAVAPVLVLDEHFRSDPHLVDFVAARIYGGHVRVATRSPWTTGRDCIDLVRVEGHRDRTGVVHAEVDWVLRRVHEHLRIGSRSVGVLTPFRAQADAIESAVLRELSLEGIESLDLRVGTVHAFQGNERDVIVASLGVGPEERSTSWRFVEDAELFTVLMTRARRHLTLVFSADPPDRGLLADYLAQADDPPGPPVPGPVDPWAAALAEDLRSAGLVVTTGYPTGRHAVDLVVGDGEHSAAVVCSVHSHGSAAHIRRHLALVRGGWTVIEAFPSKWADRRGELVVELLRQLR